MVACEYVICGVELIKGKDAGNNGGRCEREHEVMTFTQSREPVRMSGPPGYQPKRCGDGEGEANIECEGGCVRKKMKKM